jgi:hypothetical protein
MTHALERARRSTPSPVAAAVAAGVSLLGVVAWQSALERTAPFGLAALAWFEDLTPLDEKLLALLLLLPAIVLWLWTLRLDRPPIDSDATPRLPGPALDRSRRRALVTGLALVAATLFVAPLLFGEGAAGLGVIDYGRANRAGHTLNPVGLLAFLAGLALYVWAVADLSALWARVRRLLSAGRLTVVVTGTGLAVVLIAGLAGYLRVYDLDTLPFEMTSDHTEKLLDIAQIVDGSRPIFLPLNGGREPLQFYLTMALVMLGLPLSFLTLKLGMAAVSTLTVPPVFALGRSVGGRQVGLLAALVLALAPWHIQITRIALRSGFSVFFSALTLWLAFRALDRGRRKDWLLLGAVGALGLYGYSGYRPMAILVPSIVVMKLGVDALRARRAGRDVPLVGRDLGSHIAASALLALLVAAPLARYAVDRPDDFWGRTLSRVSDSEQALEHAPIVQLVINYSNALQMFNRTSDAAWFHSPSGRPALETIGAALLLLGVVTAGVRAWRGDWRSLAILVAVPVMLLSTAMALAFPLEVPHLTRASGAIPPVVVLVALPLPVVGRRWREAAGGLGTVAYAVVLAVLFVGSLGNTSQRVFDEYRTGYDNASHPTRQGAAVVHGFLDLGGDLDHVYLVSWPHGWDYRALGLLLGDADWNNVLEGSGPGMRDAVLLADAHRSDPKAKLYLVGGPAAQANLDHLREVYPAAVVTEHASRMPGKDFWSVLVPPASAGGG